MKTTHAIITPWSLSKGLMTWCGLTHNEAPNDTVATRAQDVTCERCRQSMRLAHETLSQWVPNLPA
jgi:hypothetical protein